MCKNPLLTIKNNGRVLSLQEIKKACDYTYTSEKSKNIIPIKCGKCDECRKEKMFEMINRIKKELAIRKNAFFLTLTYDEEHKKNLNKRDMQLFLKKYRKKQQLKYFYVGELGETTQRPHYHCIIFGELPKDLKECKVKTKNGYTQYESNEIQKIWGNGLIKISKMTLPLVFYITKYMLKNNKENEFICSWSRKPPIGVKEDSIEYDIIKPNRTKAEKNYYKYRYGDIPILEEEVEKQEIKIEEIEKQTKLKYIDYINKKRATI